MMRHVDSPFVTALYTALLLAIGFSAGITEGVKLRVCPARLEDGRPLLGIVLATRECKYSGVPRPAVDLSPTELRRMATMRERMEKTK